MEFQFERRASASALWARRVAFFSLVMLITASAGHRVGAVGTIPFFWVLGLVVTLAALALLLAGMGFYRLWVNGDKGGRAATRATLLAILVLAPFGVGLFRAYVLPRLTDISTDLDNPPSFVTAAGRRASDANPILPFDADHAVQQFAAYPEVTGRRYSQPIDRLVEIVDFVLADLGWPVEFRSSPQDLPGESRMELAASSLIFGFVSDAVLRIVDEGESTYVDMRSNSRYGFHDLGDNARKIGRFFDALDAEVAIRNMPVNVDPN